MRGEFGRCGSDGIYAPATRGRSYIISTASSLLSPITLTANYKITIGHTEGTMRSSILDSDYVQVTFSGFLLGLTITSAVIYVVYQRFLHPLAAYPGPFWASITDLWQVNQFLSLKQPYNLTELHEKYGEFVRYGPDKLSITAEEVVPLVYQKGGQRMPKTEYYDAFGSKTPNIFGMRSTEVRKSAHLYGNWRLKC